MRGQTHIEKEVFRIPLKALVLFSMVFLFVAGHVYVSSQPISVVLMAEILEEHEEHGDQDINTFESDFDGRRHIPNVTLVAPRIQVAQFYLSPPLLNGYVTHDPPPPRA
jgi:hypothetical protein